MTKHYSSFIKHRKGIPKWRVNSLSTQNNWGLQFFWRKKPHLLLILTSLPLDSSAGPQQISRCPLHAYLGPTDCIQSYWLHSSWVEHPQISRNGYLKMRTVLTFFSSLNSISNFSLHTYGWKLIRTQVRDLHKVERASVFCLTKRMKIYYYYYTSSSFQIQQMQKQRQRLQHLSPKHQSWVLCETSTL